MQQHLSIEETVARLEAKGYTVKKSGGTYRSPCPAHGGEDLNLAFTLGENGRPVFTCHSHNCSYEEIMEALGMKTEESKPTKRTAFGKTVHPTFEKAVSASAFGAGIRGKPDAVYRYDNLDGSENMSILRWNTDNGKQTRPVSKVDVGYIAGTHPDAAYPIYRLPKIARHLKSCVKTARIYVCEGEKATDAAVLVGLPATTSALGSQNAAKSDWSVLDQVAHERKLKLEIVILPDNDNPGHQYADSLVGIFSKFKSKSTVKIVSLADFPEITGIESFPEAGDFHDLLELLDGKTSEDICGMIEKMVGETESGRKTADGSLEWEPFPVDLLPKSIARLCRESAQAKNIEPVYVGINALAAVASMIGSAYKIELKSDWREPAIMWTCLVADSGSGKSPGLDSAIEPLRTLQIEADHEYDNNETLYAAEKELYDLDYDDWKRSRKKQPNLLPPAQPSVPMPETLLVDDATLEAIAEVLENNPFGILVVKDELAGWLRSFDCYRTGGSGKDLPAWLSIHGGRMLRINRKTGKKVIRADNPAVSVCGGVQPPILQRIISENEDFFDSGLTARILFAMPPDKPSYWTEVETSDEAMTEYENIFRTLKCWRKVDGAPTPENPFIVRLSPEAKDLFVRFYNSNVDERTDLNSEMKAMWAKFAGYAARLALVIHLVERIEDGASMEMLPGDVMQRAIRLVLWFKREAARIMELLRHTKCEIDFEALTVLDIIEKNGGTITTRELQHRRNKYRGKNGAKMANLVLDGLVQKGKLTASSSDMSNGKAVLIYSTV